MWRHLSSKPTDGTLEKWTSVFSVVSCENRNKHGEIALVQQKPPSKWEIDGYVCVQFMYVQPTYKLLPNDSYTLQSGKIVLSYNLQLMYLCVWNIRIIYHKQCTMSKAQYKNWKVEVCKMLIFIKWLAPNRCSLYYYVFITLNDSADKALISCKVTPHGKYKFQKLLSVMI